MPRPTDQNDPSRRDPAAPRPHDPTDPRRATNPGPEPGTPGPSVPPPTPPADQLTPPDAVKDGDGQDPPGDGTDDESDDDKEDDHHAEPEPEPVVVARRKRMARRLVLLPIKEQSTRDAPCIPDLMGVRGLEILRITVDYRDCCKAVVSGDANALDELQELSKEHFAEKWPDPTAAQRPTDDED